ncbi:unnamed protein product [Dimorphilus gyrociliatus]|uniref:NACHT domain-containing protein n=1 Tax=Dimorphilus gyrociliatus TaxID=2664684 RepID=A0A7I8VEB0_9ANNE|nr:unnamed protein product [Dimorphilus gyrociliatus]
MKALEKLNFSLQRENLQKLFFDQSIFIQVIQKLSDQNIINSKKQEEIDNQYKFRGKMKTTNLILDILATQPLNTANEIVNGLEVDNKYLSEHLMDIQNGWLKLVADLKNEWKEKYLYIKLLPLGYVREIKTTDVQASIEMMNLSNKAIFETYLNSINLNYSNFYKIFQANFNKILIQGESGIGKSVQLKYLVHSWANDYWEICKDKIIIVIISRNVLPSDDVYDTILKQNFRNIPYMNRDILMSLFQEKNSNILLFIDGADEFNILNHPLNNIFEKSNCSIPTVIWSRKRKAQTIQSSCDVTFQLTGFDSSQFKSFIQRYFISIEKSEVFIRELEQQTSTIQSLLKVPLMGLMFYFIWQELGSILDKSLYEIYEKLVVLLQKNIGLSSESILNRMLMVYKLCFIYLPSSKILVPVDKHEEEELVKCIGYFAQIIPQYHTTPRSVEIQFLHQSLQEYFAAKYLIDKFQTTKSLSYWKTSFDNQLTKMNNTKLYNVIEYIRQSSNEIFQKFLTVSEKLQEIYNCSKELKDLLANGIKDNNKLLIKDEYISNITVEILTEKLGIHCVDITLINPNIDLSFMTNQLCSKAKCLKNFIICVKSSEKFVELNANLWFSILNLLVSTKLESFILKSVQNDNNLQKSCLEKRYRNSVRDTDSKQTTSTMVQDSTPNLRTLDLCGCRLSESQSKELASLLLKCNNLHSLNIRYTKVMNSGFIDICNGLKNSCNRLKVLNLYGFGLSEAESLALGEVLSVCCQIESIDLGWNVSMGAGLNSICEGLKLSNETLKSLSVYWCDLNENQSEALRELLLHCSNIEALNLAWNKNINEGLQRVLEGLEHSHSTLTSLNLQNCNLTEKQLVYLGEWIKTCSSIKQLDLGGNRSMFCGYKMIIDNLKSSSDSITSLNFYGCNLTEFQATNLKDLLVCCSNIQSLNLAWNRNMGYGIQSIINSLKSSCNTIKTLNFCGCDIRETQLISLAELLSICPKLELLDLSYNTKMNYGLKEVINTLKTSSDNLTSLKVIGCRLTHDQVDTLKELLLTCLNAIDQTRKISLY